MNKTISSDVTFFFKIVFPSVWIGGFAFGTFCHFIYNMPEKWIFLIALLIGTVFLVPLCMPLKRVMIDGNKLIVSNYLKTISIPLSEIEQVTENIFISIRPVWIHLKNATEFSTKIMFMPKTRLCIFTSHPIVKELKELSGC
jgi:hypothetical protein